MRNNKLSFIGIVKKEYFGFVNSPLAYLILVPFLLLAGFFFYRTAFVVGDANLRPFIELLPWFLVVIAPALTMRTFTDEYKRGTIELLFSHPISEWRVVWAKYVGVLLFYLTMLATTLVMPLVLFGFSEPDIGLMLSQYIGAFLLGAMFIAVGMMMSAYIRSYIGSFLLAAVVCFGLILVGMNFVALGVPAPFNRVLIESGVIVHLNNFSRGVVDVRDVLYFVSVAGVALTAAVMKLSGRKLAESPAGKRKLWLILVLFLGVGIATNVLMASYPIQADFTANQRYSLSDGSRDLLRELPDRVTVTLYMSENLPAQMQLTVKEVGDRLRDFSRLGGDKLQVQTQIVDVSDPAAKADALGKGIQDITFNQIAEGSFQAQSGLLGIQVQYADKEEVIPFIDSAANLEYQLARTILKMTREERSKIGLVNATFEEQLVALNAILGDQYQVEVIEDDAEGVNWEELAGVIVVDDGTSTNATTSAQLTNYLSNSGNVLLAAGGVSLSAQSPVPVPSQSEYLNLLAGNGIVINKDLVHDLQQLENVTQTDQSTGQQFIIPYPYWIRATVLRENLPWSGAGAANVLMTWPSSIQVDDNEITQAKPILLTSPASGTTESNFVIEPQQKENLTISGQPHVLGAVIDRDEQRVVVIGNAHFLYDDILGRDPVNQAFVSNLVDWTAADEVLSSIPQRAEGRVPFQFASASQAQMIQWVGLLVPPVIVGVFGLAWLSRRKKRAQRTWQAGKKL